MDDYLAKYFTTGHDKKELYSRVDLTRKLILLAAACAGETLKRDVTFSPTISLEYSLSSLEIQILDIIFEQQKQNGDVPLYDGDRELGWVKFLDKRIQNYGVSEYMHPITEALSDYRPLKKLLFNLPHTFEEASFENFEILCDAQQTALTLLNNLGHEPQRGLYLFGGYGAGKTHLLSAFAKGLFAELTEDYVHMILDFTSGVFDEYKVYNQLVMQKENLRFVRATDNSPEGKLMAKLNKLHDQKRSTLKSEVKTHFQRAKKAHPFHPTDLAFATFDDLFDQREDKDFVMDFISRRIIVIDDIHPKGDRNRRRLIEKIIEYRYNEVGTGATFITSNLSPEQLLLSSDPEDTSPRAHSRLRTMCTPIEFKTDDYRLKIAEKADNDLLALSEKS